MLYTQVLTIYDGKQNASNLNTAKETEPRARRAQPEQQAHRYT